MKKCLLLFVLLFLPFVVNAEICDTDKIIIDSIELKDKSDGVKEMSNPVIEGKRITFDINMSDVDDFIR